MKKILKMSVIIWIVFIILTFIVVKEELDFTTRFVATFIFAVLTTIGILGGDTAIGHSNHKDTGLYSCKKCGYLGTSSGICPKCGWNTVDKIYCDTKIISCRKCGFLGAGPGICPKCGSNRVDIVRK